MTDSATKIEAIQKPKRTDSETEKPDSEIKKYDSKTKMHD
jgi:hypothetical protein